MKTRTKWIIGIVSGIVVIGVLTTIGPPITTSTPTPITEATFDRAPSVHTKGDVDCDGDVDAVDALAILRHVVALPVNLPADCPPIGSSPATATPEPTPTATASPPPSTDGVPIGAIITTALGNTLTVYTLESPVSDDLFDPEPGRIFVSIDVEGCASAETEGAVEINPFQFQIQMPDNTRFDPTFGVKEPALNSTSLFANDCVRGFVTFEIPEGVTPASVVFNSYDADFNPVVLRWSIN